MDDMGRFRRAVVAWAAGGAGASAAAEAAQELAVDATVRMVVLVEGSSDQAALEALAVRHGRDLGAEGIAVVPLGGATNIGRFLDVCGPPGLDLKLAGLCDIAEEPFFRRALERVGLGARLTPDDLEPLGFHMCVADLEDELIRSLGVSAVQQVIEAEGEMRSFRVFQNQPAQRERTVEQHLRRFMGTHAGRKAQYARSLVEALDSGRIPRPLERLLAHV
ncbi:TOPRIM nucleotidyl transferase/hydrolase domain-containing protein [Streptomyces cavernae]|uniref:TOPRIM nucleotidyl transferase/hydrolase domain-containing protein n=1 Tax=Streptomyces cavernae TaxID=2259034 RepID=UPI000FEBEEA5|nr:TOPRIM nucleotidyl transferase/hydrolase domain-containing protein [Streptomyces cavernae]